MQSRPLHNEKELLGKISQGDQGAFLVLYNHYKGRIYSTSFKLLRSGTLAEEIVQDDFLKLWLRRETIPEITFFSTYLTGIARHCSFAAFKKMANSGLSPIAIDNGDVSDNSTDETILGKNYQAILQEAVQRLSPKQAEVYRLSKEQGFKREEIASIMHISPETVKAYLAQAVRSVRAYCSANMEVPLFLVLSSSFLVC